MVALITISSVISISAHLSEAVHGVLIIMLAWAAINAVSFIWWEWRNRIHGMRFYTREIKGAVALALTWVGLFSLTSAVWWMLHMRNHGGDRHFFVGPYMLVFGAAMAAWGTICWARTTKPENEGYAWIVVTVLAVLFGIWFAL